MRQLFYLSRACPGIQESDVQHILSRARSSNWRLGVTGCLLFSGRHFAQVLEGEPSILQDLAVRIAADNRHTGFLVVRDQEVGARRYPEWSMGFLYRADFADALERVLADARPLSEPESSALLKGMTVDSQMGPL